MENRTSSGSEIPQKHEESTGVDRRQCCYPFLNPNWLTPIGNSGVINIFPADTQNWFPVIVICSFDFNYLLSVQRSRYKSSLTCIMLHPRNVSTSPLVRRKGIVWNFLHYSKRSLVSRSKIDLILVSPPKGPPVKLLSPYRTCWEKGKQKSKVRPNSSAK